MTNKKGRGRPMASREVKLTPEFRDSPDIEKLGQALIAVTMRIIEQKQVEDDAKKVRESHSEDKGDSMT